MPESVNRLAEAMHTPPRIRAACLWGDALEHRVDFDAAYWFQYFADDDIMSHFEKTMYIRLPDGDVALEIEQEHAEWGCIELVTEIMDEHPAFAPLFQWLSDKGVAGFTDEEDGEGEFITEFVEVYLSRADALKWLRANRPDLYADIKSIYSVPPPEARIFP